MDSRKTPVIHEGEEDCPFCPTGQREWFNQPLASESGCAIAIPSLGSFIPGYLLIVPTVHVTATCKVPSDSRAKFATFTDKLVVRLRSLYGMPVTMFEHGACTESSITRSACVTHAHLHLIPGNYDLMSAAPKEAIKHTSLEDFLEYERNAPYLMLQDPDGPLLSFDDRPSSQFFRRIIANRLSMPDCWDYALVPFFDNIKRTYKDFELDTL